MEIIELNENFSCKRFFCQGKQSNIYPVQESKMYSVEVENDREKIILVWEWRHV